MNKLFRLIASGLGSGDLPKIPGTWGSMAYVGLWAIWAKVLGLNELTLLFLVTAIGTIAVAKVLAESPKEGKNDPAFIVVDEWIGMGIALWALPMEPWFVIPASFFLFRLLDGLKPGPIRMIERLPGAIGVIGDDVLAGLITNFLLKAFL
jgi:phosphatidylglycerophosphatase A